MFSVSEVRVIFPGSSQILAILGHFRPVANLISTLNFGPWTTKLGGTAQATKKRTHIDNEPGPGRIYRETTIFMFCCKADFGHKSFFFKAHLKSAKRLIFFWEKGVFFLAQLCTVVARTGFPSKRAKKFGFRL